MKTVVIADDHSIVRQGLKRILTSEDEFSVLAEAQSIPQLRSVLAEKLPDALILDLSMPGGGGLEVLKEIKINYPKLPVLVLTLYSEDQFGLRVFKAGGSGYLCKECAPEQLLEALRKILSGKRYFSNATEDLVVDELGRKSDSNQLPHQRLSDRELYVFTQIGKGLALTQISNDLSLSVKTVSTYRQRVLEKMQMSSNAQIVKYVFENGLL